QPRSVDWAERGFTPPLLTLAASLGFATDLVGSRTPDLPGLAQVFFRVPKPPARMATGSVVRTPLRSTRMLAMAGWGTLLPKRGLPSASVKSGQRSWGAVGSVMSGA